MKIVSRETPELPKYLKIGYTFFGQCDEKIFEAVQNGLNVIIWSQVDIISDNENKKPIFNGNIDYNCVAKMKKKFIENNYYVINLISVGGWNCPHINSNYSPKEYLKEWISFNERIYSTGNYFFGFDGINWDIEGNDDLESNDNNFTYKELDIIGKFSQLLKKEGFIVSMSPLESYLDPSTEEFSLSLLNINKEWENKEDYISYHGKNVYSYLIAKYSLNTFDFISVLLYEDYSHALYKFKEENITFGEIIEELVKNFTNGYLVDFSVDTNSGLGKRTIKIKKDKIVIGLGNAWSSNIFLFIDEYNMTKGYEYLKEQKRDVRGFLFWNIGEEGNIPLNDYTNDKSPFYMDKIFNNLFY